MYICSDVILLIIIVFIVVPVTPIRGGCRLVHMLHVQQSDSNIIIFILDILWYIFLFYMILVTLWIPFQSLKLRNIFSGPASPYHPVNWKFWVAVLDICRLLSIVPRGMCFLQYQLQSDCSTKVDAPVLAKGIVYTYCTKKNCLYANVCYSQTQFCYSQTQSCN